MAPTGVAARATVGSPWSPQKQIPITWWDEAGVHQNLAFPVYPEPVSGQHCWHQKVRLDKAGPTDRYGDVFVDTNKSMVIYREWLALTRPGPGPGNLRRPLELLRAYRPAPRLPCPCIPPFFPLTQPVKSANVSH